MKKLLCLITLGVSLFASELIVKKADVKISVNGDVKELTKNEKLSLLPGSSICFLDGKGKVIIDKRKQLTKKSKKCYTTAIPKDFNMEDFLKNLADTAKVALITGDLKVKNGVSTKSIQTTETLTGNINITKGQKELIVLNETYGPLPISLKIYDIDKNIIQEFINEEDEVTLFRIPSVILNDNYNIVITNAFDDELLNQVITKDKK